MSREQAAGSCGTGEGKARASLHRRGLRMRGPRGRGWRGGGRAVAAGCDDVSAAGRARAGRRGAAESVSGRRAGPARAGSAREARARWRRAGLTPPQPHSPGRCPGGRLRHTARRDGAGTAWLLQATGTGGCGSGRAVMGKRAVRRSQPVQSFP